MSTDSKSMSLDEARTMFPGFRQDLPNGNTVFVFEITEEVAEKDEQWEPGYALIFVRPRSENDPREFGLPGSGHSALLKDDGKHYTEVYISKQAAWALLFLLLRHLDPVLAEEATQAYGAISHDDDAAK